MHIFVCRDSHPGTRCINSVGGTDGGDTAIRVRCDEVFCFLLFLISFIWLLSHFHVLLLFLDCNTCILSLYSRKLRININMLTGKSQIRINPESVPSSMQSILSIILKLFPIYFSLSFSFLSHHLFHIHSLLYIHDFMRLN